MLNKKRLLWQLPFLAFLIIGTVLIVSRQQSTPYQHDRGMVFGTVYHITYQSTKSLQKDIEAELAKVDFAGLCEEAYRGMVTKRRSIYPYKDSDESRKETENV